MDHSGQISRAELQQWMIKDSNHSNLSNNLSKYIPVIHEVFLTVTNYSRHRELWKISIFFKKSLKS